MFLSMLAADPMPVGESLLIALFLLVVVFAVLFCLFGCIRLFSFVVEKFGKMRKSDSGAQSADGTAEKAAAELSCDELKLIEVDEPTAAIIMAVVSDESGIPLEELRFKSIKRLSSAEKA